MSEIKWYSIPGFSSYWVSDDLQIKSFKSSSLKFMKSTKGQVTLKADNGEKLTARLPRLLFAAKNNINPVYLHRTDYVVYMNNGKPCIVGKDEFRSLIKERMKERCKPMPVDVMLDKYQEYIDVINSIKYFLETGDSSHFVTILYSKEDVLVKYILSTLHVTNEDVAKDIFRDAVDVCLDTIIERKRAVVCVHSYMRSICRSLYARRVRYKTCFKSINDNEKRRII